MIEQYGVFKDFGGRVQTVLYVVLDSLRLDSFLTAKMPNLHLIKHEFYARFSYATWTQPSHTCILNGLLPFESVPGAAASAVYNRDLSFWSHVFAGNSSEKYLFLPSYSVADFARLHGWRTIGHVSLPVLSAEAGYSRGFDSYASMQTRGNIGAQFEEASIDMGEDRNFIFINSGDTHYPYLINDSELPRVSGLHGAAANNCVDVGFQFSKEDFQMLHASQKEAAELFDKLLPSFLDVLPKPVLLVVTSDHGELFGEDGFFGHGPFNHPLLTRVPLVMAVVK